MRNRISIVAALVAASLFCGPTNASAQVIYVGYSGQYVNYPAPYVGYPGPYVAYSGSYVGIYPNPVVYPYNQPMYSYNYNPVVYGYGGVYLPPPVIGSYRADMAWRPMYSSPIYHPNYGHRPHPVGYYPPPRNIYRR